MIAYRFHIVGAGRLGKTLGKLLSQHASYTLQGIVNQTLASAQAACVFIGAGQAYASIADLPAADVVLITCPDDRIAKLSHVIRQNTRLEQAILIHCSGNLSSDILRSSTPSDHLVGSLHPLKSFADPELAVATFAGTYCAYEGDAVLDPILSTLITDMGGIGLPIPTAQKSLYHAGSVMLTNFIVALYQLGETTLTKAGIQACHARGIARHMMQSTVTNSLDLCPQTALTGPAKRGDIKTIQSHLKALSGADRPIYIALTQFIAENMQPDPAKRAQLLALLDRSSSFETSDFDEFREKKPLK